MDDTKIPPVEYPHASIAAPLVQAYILEHLEERRLGKVDTMGLLLFKPDCPSSEYPEFERYCNQESLAVLYTQSIHLRPETIIALYPNIFSFSPEDLKFGVDWKKQTIDHLASGTSIYAIVKGEQAQKKLSYYKYKLRERYGKITHPQHKLPANDFFEKVIKNLVHVVDTKELQNAFWLLLGDEKLLNIRTSIGKKLGRKDEKSR